jgi:hypothetical protein
MDFFEPPDQNGRNHQLQTEKDFSDIPAERRIAATQQAKKWFLILLVSGLLIGGITAIAIAQIMKKLGLADQPQYRLEIRREDQK